MAVTAHPASQRGIDPAGPPSALPWNLRLLRAALRLLRWISRGAAVRVVGRLFVKPRRHTVPQRERDFLATADRRAVRCNDRSVAVWTFPPTEHQPAPRTAILVHGWEGRGGQLGAWVEPLRQMGFRVVTFDHVGHGQSDGVRCALPTMRETLRSVAQEVLAETGETSPGAIVAHSMGTFAASLLLAEGWRSARVVYVSPPDDLLVYFSRYLEMVTGSTELLPDLIQQMEERFGESVEEFDFHHLVETLDQPLAVFHSIDDQDVPVAGGRYVAATWPGAILHEVDGLGHRRILRDPGVVESGVDFLANRSCREG